MEALTQSTADSAPGRLTVFARPRRVHLVGIAGSGMRALCDVLLGFGWQLSGSDLDVSPVKSLAAKGVRLFSGHAAAHLPADTDELIYSNAVPAENPELLLARERGIAVTSYAEMLGRLGVGRRTLAVAGTHGKSTTTAMTAHVLVQAGLDPMVVCGATPLGAASGGRAGRGDLMVVEACEYRGNFLHLQPQSAAILGIEMDHFDCYHSLEQLEGAFHRFAAALPEDGLLLVRHDCPATRRAAVGLRCRVESFGLSPEADWSAHVEPHPLAAEAASPCAGRGFLSEIRRSGQPFCEVRLQMPGRHNVLNALAAAALAHESGVTAEQIAAGLGSFPGLHRRLEVLGDRRGLTLVDDYAHHPTAVTAALTAIREMFPRRRVWCVFQPHQASRTARLLGELAASLQNADKVMVAEVFRAREGEPQPGEATAADLARRTAALGAEVLPGHRAEEITQTLETHLAPGDVLVTLGAGDVEELRPWTARSKG